MSLDDYCIGLSESDASIARLAWAAATRSAAMRCRACLFEPVLSLNQLAVNDGIRIALEAIGVVRIEPACDDLFN